MATVSPIPRTVHACAFDIGTDEKEKRESMEADGSGRKWTEVFLLSCKKEAKNFRSIDRLNCVNLCGKLAFDGAFASIERSKELSDC